MVRKPGMDNRDREEYFRFFKGFKELFFGITPNTGINGELTRYKDKGVVLFTSYLCASPKIVDHTAGSGYKIKNEEKPVFGKINGAASVCGNNNVLQSFGNSQLLHSIQGILGLGFRPRNIVWKKIFE